MGGSQLLGRNHSKIAEYTNCLAASDSSFGRAKQGTEEKDTKAYIKFITD